MSGSAFRFWLIGARDAPQAYAPIPRRHGCTRGRERRAGPPRRSAFDHPRTHDHNLSRRGGHLGAGTTRAAGLAPENGPLAPAPARPRDPRDHPNRRQPGRVVRDTSLVTDACRPESSATGRTTVTLRTQLIA